ncbi:phosphate ABC transporter substrate-binding protein [Magnetococcus sp. PR-3]|uniref:phosphate ABC transporter substrate-binding protein n=1 Tax=Magnetococcus sp. PR-3 TaxID=3120355 RepID=UPI002FCE19D8
MDLRWLRIICCLSTFCVCTAAFSQSLPLRISGSSTILPVVKAAARQFSEEYSMNIHVYGGGSSIGVQQTLNRHVDIGMVSRSLTDKERQAGLQTLTIGHDAIVVIINKFQEINELSKEQIKRIFEGDIQNWQEVGGKAGTIQRIAKRTGRSTRKLFDSFMGLQKLSSDTYQVGSNTEGLVLVGTDPYAIGYVSIGSAIIAMDRGLNIRMLTIDNHVPSVNNLQNGAYPYSRKLNLITLGEPSKKAQSFLNYMQTPERRKLVLEHAFLTSAPEESPAKGSFP